VVLQDILKMTLVVRIDQFSIARQIHVMHARLPVYSPVKTRTSARLLMACLWRVCWTMQMLTSTISSAGQSTIAVLSWTARNCFYSYPTVTGT